VSETVQRTIVLGKTDGFRYLGVQPPLTREELADLPMPGGERGATFMHGIAGMQRYAEDNCQDIGFYADPGGRIETDEGFTAYAKEVADYLGGAELHETVQYIGPGSVIAQVLHGAEAEF
jgi:hypothetical protein